MVDVGWYRTTIRSFEREIFCIPNSVFSRNVVLNVTRKQREWRFYEFIGALQVGLPMPHMLFAILFCVMRRRGICRNFREQGMRCACTACLNATPRRPLHTVMQVMHMTAFILQGDTRQALQACSVMYKKTGRVVPNQCVPNAGLRVDDISKAAAVVADMRKIIRQDPRIIQKLHRRVFIDKLTREQASTFQTLQIWRVTNGLCIDATLFHVEHDVDRHI